MSKAPYFPTIPHWRDMRMEALAFHEGFIPMRLSPELVVIGWAIDAAMTGNGAVVPACFKPGCKIHEEHKHDSGWQPERLDWRGLYRDELASVPQLSSRLEYNGPESVYELARLSEGEKDAIRMHHEGYSEFDVALAKIGLTWDNPKVVRWRMAGASEREIAIRLSAPFWTIRKQLQRARVKLRKLADVVDRKSKDCLAAEAKVDRSFFYPPTHRGNDGPVTTSHTPEEA